jgi:hypothetical protein
MGWTAGVRFAARARDFSLLHSVQTGSGAHSDSDSMGNGDSIPGAKAAGADRHIVPRLKMVELYLQSSICLHSIVLNYIIKYRDNFNKLACLMNTIMNFSLP